MYDRMTGNQKWVFLSSFYCLFFLFLISVTHFLLFGRMLLCYVFRYRCYERGYLTLGDGFAGILRIASLQEDDVGYIPVNKIDLFCG